MKSLREYSLCLPEQEYHNLDSWSYSMIAKYAREGFSSIAKIHEHTPPTAAMDFGSLFDCYITNNDKVNEIYAVSDFVPTEGVKSVLDYLLFNRTCPFEEITKEQMTEAMDASAFYLKWGYDSRYKQIEKARSYYDARRTGKKVVSAKDWEDVVEMARIFKSDNYLSKLFSHDHDDIEYIYQAQFQTMMFTPGGRYVSLKIMPDLLVVNHKDKTIQPVDLKTSSMPSFKFYESFVKFRYDIQASLYTDVLEYIKNQDVDYVDYKILEYIFTDISRVDKVPTSYHYDPRSESQINGLSFSGYQYKGWKDLLDEILYYEETAATVPSYIHTDRPNDIIKILETVK